MNNEDDKLRQRLAGLRVLVADRDHRTAQLVHGVLFSFGFRNMDITTNGEGVLKLLRTRSYSIIVTEWNMQPVDGLELVKAIRTAKEDERIPRDIPILMLTARSDRESVIIARDAGISEFVAKPFTAKALSGRIIQIIDSPRSFVESVSYVGPDRRRRGKLPEGVKERRGRGKGKLLPANVKLKKQLGEATAAELINEFTVAKAQSDLLQSENDFMEWARQDIELLESAFRSLKRQPEDTQVRATMTDIAYSIKSQAGIFGYPMGTEAAALLVDYLNARRKITSNNLIVIGKLIEAIAAIFRQKVKDDGEGLAQEMIASLRLLAHKL